MVAGGRVEQDVLGEEKKSSTPFSVFSEKTTRLFPEMQKKMTF